MPKNFGPSPKGVIRYRFGPRQKSLYLRKTPKADVGSEHLHLLRTPMYWCGSVSSLGLDVRLTNDFAVFVGLSAQERRKVRAAGSGRIETLSGELRTQLRSRDRSMKPVGKLGDRFLRCFRRHDRAGPDVFLEIFTNGLGNGRNVRQRIQFWFETTRQAHGACPRSPAQPRPGS